jgi:hypothetical protein
MKKPKDQPERAINKKYFFRITKYLLFKKKIILTPFFLSNLITFLFLIHLKLCDDVIGVPPEVLQIVIEL